MAGTFGWKNSLALDAQLAKRFYGIIALATIVGLALDFTSLDPIKALFWSAVINGVTSVPIMVLMMLTGCCCRVVGFRRRGLPVIPEAVSVRPPRRAQTMPVRA